MRLEEDIPESIGLNDLVRNSDFFPISGTPIGRRIPAPFQILGIPVSFYINSTAEKSSN